MVSLNKTLMILFLFALFCILMLGALNCPLDKTDERTKCRKEIARIRDCLRNCHIQMEVEFVDWRTNFCDQSATTLPEQVGSYCWGICNRASAPVFNFRTIDGVHYLIDPWGECYNIAKTNELDILK